MISRQYRQADRELIVGDTASGQRFESLRAKFAEKGYCLKRLMESPYEQTFRVSKDGASRYYRSFEAIVDLLEQIGGAQ